MRRRAVLLSLFLGACGPNSTGDGPGGEDPDPGGQPDGGGTPSEFTDAAPAERCDKMDILFVIDNSGSMGQEQTNLGTNFPLFIDVLNSFSSASGPLDYHVGVTTTGVTKSWTTEPPIMGFPPINDDQTGDDGALLTGSACNMPRSWLERTDPDVSGSFSCVANVGTSGPADEMPLEGMRLALTDRVSDGTNAGFLRDDALLALVILTDENDCSRTDDNFSLSFSEDICDTSSPVPDYLNVVDTVKGDRGRWAVAVIAGAGPGSCSSSLGDAEEATRLLDFANQTGDNAVVSSICDGDLAGALEQALQTFDSACQAFPPID